MFHVQGKKKALLHFQINQEQRECAQKMIMNRLMLFCNALRRRCFNYMSHFPYLWPRCSEAGGERGMKCKELILWTAEPWESAIGHLIVCSCLCFQGQKKEKDNKKTSKCCTNPAVNESGSLQQFFYALSIPQGDKHNAEPAPSTTSPTPLHCKHCGLPHFMSVNSFKPANTGAGVGQRAFGDTTHPLVAALDVRHSLSTAVCDGCGTFSFLFLVLASALNSLYTVYALNWLIPSIMSWDTNLTRTLPSCCTQ